MCSKIAHIGINFAAVIESTLCVPGNYVELTNQYFSMKLLYWTGLYRCPGGEVGGEVKIALSSDEIAFLETLVDIPYEETADRIKAENEDLFSRISSAAYDDFEDIMAEDAMGDYDFSAPEFDNWTHEQKIAYIRKDVDPDVKVEDLCELAFEVKA